MIVSCRPLFLLSLTTKYINAAVKPRSAIAVVSGPTFCPICVSCLSFSCFRRKTFSLVPLAFFTSPFCFCSPVCCRAFALCNVLGVPFSERGPLGLVGLCLFVSPSQNKQSRSRLADETKGPETLSGVPGLRVLRVLATRHGPVSSGEI